MLSVGADTYMHGNAGKAINGLDDGLNLRGRTQDVRITRL